MRPRIRRLYADFEKVSQAFAEHPYINIESYEGDPPDHYLLRMNIPGLELPKGEEVFLKNEHLVEVILPLEYPRRPPFCRMRSSVYHPNIDPGKICIGDHWSAGQSLAHLIIRIAEMITFQSYNTQSPLNAEAAAWAEQNQSELPLLQQDLGVTL